MRTEKGKKGKTALIYGLGITGILVSIIISGYIASLQDDQSYKLSIYGIEATIFVAIGILLIQTWMSRRITNLTNEIHNMTEEYKNRRKQRIDNFKQNAIKDLEEVKKQYNNLSQAIIKYQKTRTLSNKDVEIYVKFIQADLEYALIQVESNFEFAKEYINNINLITSLFSYLADLESDFMNILELTKKYKTEEHMKEIQPMIKDALGTVDKFIQEIKKEPS